MDLSAAKKHRNTKHNVKPKDEEINDISVCDSKCSVCDDKFENTQEFKKHIQVHINEIGEIYLEF